MKALQKNKSPKNKKELISNIKELIGKGVTDLNCIDTSKITDMSYLFDRELSKIKNINISNWDVSNVENMHSMFIYCENFEGKGLENWDVSNVKDMGHMFKGCTNFDADLSSWDVSNVTTMSEMFYYCKKFTGKGLEKWNISKVKNTDDMFWYCHNLKNKPSWYKE